MELSPWGPDNTVGSPAAPTSAQKQSKKGESQSSSSKSESMQNSPKSCPTPEVSMGVPSAACAFQPEGNKCVAESTSKVAFLPQ